MCPDLFHLILCCEHFPKSLVFKNMIFFFNGKIPFHSADFYYVSGTLLDAEVTDVNRTEPISAFLRMEMQNGIVTLKTVGRFLTQLNKVLPYDPAITLLCVYPTDL